MHTYKVFGSSLCLALAAANVPGCIGGHWYSYAAAAWCVALAIFMGVL